MILILLIILFYIIYIVYIYIPYYSYLDYYKYIKNFKDKFDNINYEDEIKYNPPYNDSYLKLPSIIDINIKRNIKKKDNNNITIIIATLSSPFNIKKRFSFRCLYKKNNIMNQSKVIFFMGYSKYEKGSILHKELFIYNDIVQFEFINSYLNLTLLSIMALKYCYRNFKNIKYYIKTDDDMLINYKLLLFTLKKINPYYNFVYGHLGGNYIVNRNNATSNYIPYFVYEKNYIPYFVYGGLIIITKRALSNIYNQTLFRQKYIWREDINLGILCNISNITMLQFSDEIDIKLKENRCDFSSKIIASEIKTDEDRIFCINHKIILNS